jgi:hypothetical protein
MDRQKKLSSLTPILVPLSTPIKNNEDDYNDDYLFQDDTEARLHIPAGILRIPVFPISVALFSQKSQFLFRHNLGRKAIRKPVCMGPT